MGGAGSSKRQSEKERMEVKTESLRLTLSSTNRGGQRAGHLRARGPQGVNSWMTPRIVTGTGKKGSRQVSLHLRLWTQSHVFQLSPKSTDESITSASPVKQKEKGTHSLLLCPLSLRLCVGVCRCVWVCVERALHTEEWGGMGGGGRGGRRGREAGTSGFCCQEIWGHGRE